MSALEVSVGKGCVAAYLQGCCGDIRPALIRSNQFYRGGDADVYRLGRELAAAVDTVLAGPMERCPNGSLAAQNITVDLETQSGAFSPLRINHVSVSEKLALVTFNAEVVVEYGLHIRSMFAPLTLPVAYTNGMLGYITTAQQLAEGGYEAADSHRYFNLPAPFCRNSEDRILDALRWLDGSSRPITRAPGAGPQLSREYDVSVDGAAVAGDDL
jgi:hypothetical protein